MNSARRRALSVGVAALLGWVPPSAGAEELPAYPGASLTPIGAELEVGGERYRVGYFVSVDSPRKVAAFFATAWKAAGYPCTLDGRFVEEGVVTAFHTREGLVRSVVLRRRGARTLGLAVVQDAWASSSDGSERPMPGRLDGEVLGQEVVGDALAASRQRTALIERPLALTRSALVERLTGEGFVSRKETVGRREQVLEWSRRDEQLVVTLAEAEPGLTAVSWVWLREGEGGGGK